MPDQFNMHLSNSLEHSILSVQPIIATHMSMGTDGKKACILKYQLNFKNNLINNGCATIHHLSVQLFIICQLIVTIIFWPQS